jgi:hypothetical protein
MSGSMTSVLTTKVELVAWKGERRSRRRLRSKVNQGLPHYNGLEEAKCLPRREL